MIDGRKVLMGSLAAWNLLNIIDIVTTYAGITSGFGEANRFYAALFNHSIMLPLLLKFIAVLAVSYMIYKAYNYFKEVRFVNPALMSIPIIYSAWYLMIVINNFKVIL